MKDKGDKDDQQKQIQSLTGRIDKRAMGYRDEKSKPKRMVKPKQNKGEGASHIVFKGGNIFEQKFDQTLIYRPKTQQNKLKYENFLGRMNKIVQDLPQQTLLSVADQVLAILKGNQTQIQKKLNTEAIIGQKINQQQFLDLINVVKSITDYKLDEQNHMQNQIALNEDQQQQDQQQQQYMEQIDPNEQMQEKQKQPNKKHQKRKSEKQVKNQMDIENQNQGQSQNQDQVKREGVKLNANDIDAHWFHSKLSKYFQPSQAQKIGPQILQALSYPTKLQTQNSLLQILNYDQYQLIKLLLENKDIIYYCTKYHHSQNEKQKQQLIQQMKSKDINILTKKSAAKPSKSEFLKKSSNQPVQSQKQQQQFLHIPQFAKDEQIHRIQKKLLDLTLHDSSQKITSKQQYKFKLPHGATKTDHPGYEQVYIPAIENKNKQKLIDIEELPAWMQPVFVGVKRLNAIQSRVCEHTLGCDKNMLVCAPTSAGKTNIALMAILRVMSLYMGKNGAIDTSKFKIVYIAPMKALVAEITGNLGHRLSPLGVNVRELTGDMHLTKGQIQDTQVIVSTPEKWDIVTRKAGDRLFTEAVRLLIIDQIHLLSDSRGPVLQSLIARSIRQSENFQEHIRIVGLSATLPNYKDVGATLRVKPNDGLFYFDQSYRPVPLQQLYCGITEKKGARKMMMTNQILYQKVMQRVSNNQMIIFVHSRRQTFKTANYLLQTAYSKNSSHKILKPESESKKILQRIISQSQQQKSSKINSNQLKTVLADGIGIHHAGLSRSDRDLVQQLFADRHLNVLVSTATLAWGVNLPAHTVIIKGTQVYSAEEGRWVEISLQDVMQMLGRAGRPRFDQRGQGIIISGYEEIRYYLSMINMQLPLQSQMMKMLPDQLNAQIVLGAVNNIKDGVNWLGYTYFYVRMIKNPKYYSISPEQIQQDPQLLKRRVNLIHSAATILERNGLINYDRKSGSFNSTFLGKISSYYYVKYASMAIYNSNLKPNVGLIQLFKIFSMSLEFKHVTVREEEKIELQKLMESVPVPIKGSVQDATSKISVLLQAHISKLQLQGYALNVDKVYVTQSASRIMRALFQICVKRGWGQIAQKCLQVAKMIDRSMWSCMNPLRQFHQIPEYVLSKLQKKEQFSWESFYQMTPQQIGDLTKFAALGKIIHKFVHQVPRVQINAYAQPITRSCLKIELNIKADFRWENLYHGKEQPFWVFLLDCNEENILFSYQFSLTEKQQNFYITFIVPLFQILHPLYFVKVISDRWVCSDNILPLSFKNMILPNRFPSPNQILDLQPLPTTNLPILKQLKITYLNQIQTQVYNSFVNSEKNCFLGASQGSGKFTLALLSLHKCLQKGKKGVIMLPFKSLLSTKVVQLSKVFAKTKIGMTYEDLTKDSAVLQNMDIVLTTPQAWDILTRRWKVRKGFEKIGLFIVDGLHLLSQNYSTMEVVVSRMRYISTQLGDESYRIIGLAASTANYLDMGQWIGAPSQNIFNFHPNVRQNSVQIIFSSYDQILRESRLHTMQKNLIYTVKNYSRNAIVFVDDKKQAKLSALDFVSLLSIEPNPKRFRKISDSQMKIFAKNIIDQYLVHILEYGIGYVYQGMNEIQRQIVLKLFDTQGIGILVVTHKLKWEIQAKAFIVAILDCSYFDCRNSRWSDYTIPQMLQIMSLASTSEKDKNKSKQYSSSKFLLMLHGPKKPFYKKFLFEPLPVQSSMHLSLNLANHINSAIAIKTIKSKQDCLDWITWTFFYRRLVQNPNYYNMQEVSQEGISSYLSELIQNTIQYMERVKCVEVKDEMELSATNLSIICSYYYIKIQTVATFIQKISQSLKLKTLLQLLTQSEQLAHISYRPGQAQSLLPLLLQTSETPINKPHALLLLHLNRIPVPPQLLAQIRAILPICLRICQALVDILSSFSFLKPLIMGMQMCQMVVQALWIGDSKLLQLPGVDEHMVEMLEKEYGVVDISDFVQMKDQDRDKVLKGKDVTKIAQACNRYPMINLHHQVVGEQDSEITLNVILSRDEQLQDQTVICPYYPVQNKEQFWWVVIGDKKSNKVLATKRSPLKNRVAVNISFERIQGVDKYSLYAICDSYVGCQVIKQIQVKQDGENQGNQQNDS